MSKTKRKAVQSVIKNYLKKEFPSKVFWAHCLLGGDNDKLLISWFDGPLIEKVSALIKRFEPHIVNLTEEVEVREVPIQNCWDRRNTILLRVQNV